MGSGVGVLQAGTSRARGFTKVLFGATLSQAIGAQLGVCPRSLFLRKELNEPCSARKTPGCSQRGSPLKGHAPILVILA